MPSSPMLVLKRSYRHSIRQLNVALLYRPEMVPDTEKVTYSLLSHLGAMGHHGKIATITPISKPKDPGTMQPISLLSWYAKIVERMVLDWLKWQVGELHPHLFVFQLSRNTIICLMTLLGALRSRSSLVVFLDLEKVFEVAIPSAIIEALAGKECQGPPPAVAGRVPDRAQCLREISGLPLHPATSFLWHPAGQLSQPVSFQRTD